MAYYSGVHHRSVKNTTIAYLLLALFFSICLTFSACDQIQQVITPEGPKAGSLAAIHIGLLHSTPLPGSTLKGAQVALNELNDAGGVNGIPIKFIIKDDKNDTQRSVKLAQELISEGVLGIIGPGWSVHALQVGPIAQAAGVPLVTTYATNPTLPEAGDFVFMGAFTDNYQADVIAKFAVNSLRAKTASILTESEYAYSEGLSRFFKERFTALGGETQQSFYTVGDTDFEKQLTVIAAISPDVVFIAGAIPEVPFVVQQARKMGIKATFLGGDGWDSPELISKGGKALEGSFFVNHFSPHPVNMLTENARQFRTAYAAKFGILPDGAASLGYDAVRILVQAMQRARNLTPTAIRDEIAATKDYSGAAMISHYNEKRHPIKSCVINVITNGEIRVQQVVAP